MKFFGLMQINFHQVSRPARGAWVEIKALTCFTDLGMGRAPQGARGLKLCGQADRTGSRGVAPRKGRVG